ncbi:MAG: energy-coupled thiamine transporter ThiT [Oscillospiraceae bacterium]|nr:energy-coupled thiamine transporter ThiT [Oscillospiraceae bacterium]
MKLSKNAQMLAEGGICVALSLVLSYLKIPITAEWGGFGGSVDFVMVPLIVFAVRWGFGWGMLAGLAFGTLKYFFANGFAVSWISIIFDYSVAYAFVGLAGVLMRKYKLLPLAALIGCLCRFVIHFISGVTVYAEYMPEEFLGIGNMNPWLYSLLYNGTYMLPNTILAVMVCALLIPLMPRLPEAGE